jgi:hypothetical protein
VIIKWTAFSAFSSASKGDELEGGVESGGLKHQFSQVERDLDL